jgi:GntR family transcriptional regulator
MDRATGSDLYDAQALQSYRGRALYRGVEVLIRGLINEGRIIPGDLIPPEPQLASALGVSQGTVKKAIDNLVWEGLLYRHQGKGTYVSKVDFQKSLFRFFTYGDARGRAVRIEKRTIQRQRLKGPVDITRRMRCPDGSEVVRIDRIGLVDGQPILVEHSWWPAEVVPGLEDTQLHIPDYLYALVVDRYGVPILRAEETLSADGADVETGRMLGIAEGTPVIVLNRLTYSRGDRIVEVRTTRGRADRFTYKTEIR